MFVKICGFIDPANLAAVCAADARPDAIGLNFWDGSKRYVGAAAGDLTDAAAGVPAWGVFVNASDDDVIAAARTARLAGVQLHGDEPPGAFERPLTELTEDRPRTCYSFVRAWRFDGSLKPLMTFLAAGDELEAKPNVLLIDAATPGAYGGTGVTADWAALRAELDELEQFLIPRIVLAGGLTPENVAEAVRIVRPWGVDVAGGVESRPGIKDPARVAAFCDAARSA